MARQKHDGHCYICNQFGRLTYEHLPPEAAFNSKPVYELDAEAFLSANSSEELEAVRRSARQRGRGGYTLCGRCNNDTGAWYGRAYVEWARQGFRNLTVNPGYTTPIPFVIRPLRVFKQVISMFASSCGPGLFEKNVDLRRFVLNREENCFPRDMRVFAYYVHPESKGLRQTGLISTADFAQPSAAIRVFAEIAFPPFGYILCVSSSPPPDDRIVDISFMAAASWHEQREMTLQLPTLRVDGSFPADFRSRAELHALLDMPR